MKNLHYLVAVLTFLLCFSLHSNAGETPSLAATASTHASTDSTNSIDQMKALLESQANTNLTREIRTLVDSNRLPVLELLTYLGQDYPYKGMSLHLTGPNISSFSSAAVRKFLTSFSLAQIPVPLLEVLLSGLDQGIVLQLLANQHYNKPNTITWVINKLLLQRRSSSNPQPPALLLPFIKMATDNIIKDHDQRTLRVAGESAATCLTCTSSAACMVACCWITHGHSIPYSGIITSALTSASSAGLGATCCGVRLLAEEQKAKQNEANYQRLQEALAQLNPTSQPQPLVME